MAQAQQGSLPDAMLPLAELSTARLQQILERHSFAVLRGLDGRGDATLVECERFACRFFESPEEVRSASRLRDAQGEKKDIRRRRCLREQCEHLPLIDFEGLLYLPYDQRPPLLEFDRRLILGIFDCDNVDEP